MTNNDGKRNLNNKGNRTKRGNKLSITASPVLSKVTELTKYKIILPDIDLQHTQHASDQYQEKVQHELLKSIIDTLNQLSPAEALPHLYRLYEGGQHVERRIIYAPITDNRFGFDPKTQPIEALFSDFLDAATGESSESTIHKDESNNSKTKD